MNISNSSFSLHRIKQNITGYSAMVQRKLLEGYKIAFLTFMFRPIPGSHIYKNRIMRNDIKKAYELFRSKWHRKPGSQKESPFLIGAPDWRVEGLPEITINDGLHYHGVLVAPFARSRIKIPLEQHFQDKQDIYIRGTSLERIHVEPLTNNNIPKVVDYSLKGMKLNRLPDEETLLIL